MKTSQTDLASTIAYLSRHHGDIAQIPQRVRRSFARRHDDGFWTFWQQWLEPVFSSPAKIIDLGTGEGLFLHALTQRYDIAGIGLECAPYMLKDKLDIPNCYISEQDLHQPHINVADNSQDVIMASMLLHELKQPIKVLLEARRCLKQGGRLCVIDLVRGQLKDYLKDRYSDDDGVFDLSASAAAFEDAFRHFMEHNQYTADDLIYLLEICGFKLLHQQSISNGEMVRLVAEKI